MSGNTAFSPARDLTSKQAKTGGGMDMRILWICGHKHRYGLRKGRLTLRCADCMKAAK